MQNKKPSMHIVSETASLIEDADSEPDLFVFYRLYDLQTFPELMSFCVVKRGTKGSPQRKEIYMAKIVSSWNDWDPLKRVIVGRCDNSMIPPEEPATSEKVPVDSEMRGMWGLRPLATVERGNECLENLSLIHI